MSRLFRGKYLAGLERARSTRKLQLEPASIPSGAENFPWKRRLDELRAVDWVVYAKPPFGGPERVLEYLSPYTHRVAISNRRIVSIDHGLVRLVCKDYARGRASRIVRLSAHEFLRRFLLHVLPRGFVRIRHYGILANRHRQKKLARARALLAGVPSSPPGDDPASNAAADTIESPTESPPPCGRCPSCGGALVVLELIAPKPRDTS